jgi:hypothetical protein
MTLGSATLREVFNQITEPKFSAAQALMRYTRDGDNAEVMVLTFNGVDQSGTPFTAESPMLPAGTDVQAAAADVARGVLNPPP